uniref:Uncharacterized protein n=1 Tax=Aegilops tauschii subsp. strangulata TaxID=200361 RepID=A0A453GY55_AEGTS
QAKTIRTTLCKILYSQTERRRTLCKILSTLMEGKAILLCLVVILQLGNSIHVEQCFSGVVFGGHVCTESQCRSSCQQKWGNEVVNSFCRVDIPDFFHCYCIVCDS